MIIRTFLLLVLIAVAYLVAMQNPHWFQTQWKWPSFSVSADQQQFQDIQSSLDGLRTQMADLKSELAQLQQTSVPASFEKPLSQQFAYEPLSQNVPAQQPPITTEMDGQSTREQLMGLADKMELRALKYGY